MYRIPAVIAAWTAAGDGPRDAKTFFRFPELFASCPVLKEVLVLALGCSEAAAMKQCVLIAANRNDWYTFSRRGPRRVDAVVVQQRGALWT
jgi:hypothetical protein